MFFILCLLALSGYASIDDFSYNEKLALASFLKQGPLCFSEHMPVNLTVKYWVAKRVNHFLLEQGLLSKRVFIKSVDQDHYDYHSGKALCVGYSDDYWFNVSLTQDDMTSVEGLIDKMRLYPDSVFFKAVMLAVYDLGCYSAFHSKEMSALKEAYSQFPNNIRGIYRLPEYLGRQYTLQDLFIAIEDE